MSLFHDTPDDVEQAIKRRLLWRNYHTTTDAVLPLTMRRIYQDGIEHSVPSIGTGFLMSSFDLSTTYLISNLHCLSGCDLDANPIGSFIPNFLDIGMTYARPTEDPRYYDRCNVVLRYPLQDEDGTSLFFHPQRDESGKCRADIAILPIAIEAAEVAKSGGHFNTRYVTYTSLYLDRDLGLGDDCFIIGYPRGLSGDGSTPIWKRATIASEPHNTYRDDLVFLVDTATREGMSGSPVFSVKQEYSLSDRARGGIEEKTEERLIGIYSGRIGTDELGVQLGKVWSVELLRLLIAGLPKPIASITPTQAFYPA